MVRKLELARPVGSTAPISIRVRLKEPADLSVLPITFALIGTDRKRTPLVAGSTAGIEVTDFSAAEKAPARTVWMLTYRPGPGELVREGLFRGKFHVDHGDNKVIDYPYGRNSIELYLRPAA